MNALRSFVFALGLVVTIPPWALFAFLTFPFRAHTRYRIIGSWTHIAMWLARHVLGIRYRVLGRENLPDAPSVILAKHQSAWETLAFQVMFPPICFVLKRELLRIPFFGWGLAQMPVVAIDRAAGKDALAQVVEQGGARLREGFWVVVFPEGTRVAPGTTRRYKIGGAWLATHVGAQVVPVAHNAGEFWPKNAWIKRPGEVVVSIGPPIDAAGREPDAVNAEAEAWIEAEMRRLFPGHYDGTAIR
jgi:1-acyl-sn-glycerol-3-phosphate acyltransferase